MSRLAKLTLLAFVTFFNTASISLAHAHMDGHGMTDVIETRFIEVNAVVKSVSVDARRIKVAHEPIPELSWPKMTMGFAVAQGVDLEAVAVGSAVTLKLVGRQDGSYAIHEIFVREAE